MPEPAPTKRLALPRELRLILSLGSVIFVLGYLVLPQFGPARSSLHLLATVNPVLVVVAVLLEIGAILAYVGLTRTVLYPYAPSRLNTLRVNLAGLAISHVVPGGRLRRAPSPIESSTTSGCPRRRTPSAWRPKAPDRPWSLTSSSGSFS